MGTKMYQSRMGDPEVIEAINFFRKKAGLEPLKDKIDERLKRCYLINAENAKKIRNLEKTLHNVESEVAYEQERIKAFFNLLNTVKDESRKIAVMCLFYWDTFGLLNYEHTSRLRDRSEGFRKLLEVVGNFDNIEHLNRWIGTEELRQDLLRFGYGEKGSYFRAMGNGTSLLVNKKLSKPKAKRNARPKGSPRQDGLKEHKGKKGAKK